MMHQIRLAICAAGIILSMAPSGPLGAIWKQAPSVTNESEATRPAPDVAPPGQWQAGEPVEEARFTETLDGSVLETVAAQLQSLATEIAEKEKKDPHYVLRAGWA